MKQFLLEIGCEEIPAGYIENSLTALKNNLIDELNKNKISFSSINSYATPRRLALIAYEMAESQEAIEEEFSGPPKKIAFDKDGNPTIAAKKFAEKIGLSLKEIEIKKTEKGEYLFASIKRKPLKTEAILTQILPQIILKTPFPKSMRWGKDTISFARPIQTVTSLLDKKVLKFKVGLLESSNFVLGHRFMANKKIVITSPKEYISKLKKAFVIADIKERKALVKKEILKCTKKTNGNLLEDDSLLDIVTNLVEYPFAILGNFEKKFLSVPPEIPITAMREHQKYFSIINKQNKLMPYFVAINNSKAKDMDLVKKGHERVLRARLSDVKFFYETDKKSSLNTFRNKLKKVLFQAQLGTVYDKSLRIEKLASFILLKNNLKKYEKDIQRAAKFCKCDLVSQVVIEFPKLQGVIGGAYANLAKEKRNVYEAIKEHYLPIHSGGALPETKLGAILSIADKIDTICGCFSINLIPTGNEDPYALRRNGIGIIQIIEKHKLNFSIQDTINKNLALYGKKNDNEIADKVYDFLKKRMLNLFVEAGFEKDIVSSVIKTNDDNILSLKRKIEAFTSLKTLKGFDELLATFKRVSNVVKNQKIKAGKIDEKLLKQNEEKQLFKEFKKIEKETLKYTKKQDYEKALSEIAKLKPFVDNFFDNVMVMAEDEKIKTNRITLLKNIIELFETFAKW